MIGRNISHYRVLEKLGEGGMGVVYRAEDTKLERPVALKLLPPHLLGDEDSRKRFEREAKSAAALSHANICTVYEIDDAESQVFIAMELIEGESLDKKIARGPLKLDEALSVAQQVAKGLEAAHQRGVVHRDIKPENIMVGEGGHVTIMDFGLAQLAEASRLTKTDETVGTVAYMSPEQTEGSGTDHRTDIWSLGVVLYEMVTGQKPFKGDYDKAVMYSILNEEPQPITSLRTAVPIELELVIGKCLAKAPADRYASASEINTDLRKLSARLDTGQSRAAPMGPTQPGAGTALETPRWRSPRVHTALTIALALIALAAIGTRFSGPAGDLQGPLRRFQIVPPPLVDSDRSGSAVAISPDGEHIAFASGDPDRSLWVQDLRRPAPRAIPGTEDARGPFWSPDSAFIGFAAGDKLMKVAVDEGLAVPLCDLPSGLFGGGTWSPDGEMIAFAAGDRSPIYSVSPNGGRAKLLFAPAEESPSGFPSAASPHFLQSSADVPLLAFSVGLREQWTLFVQELATGRRVELGPGYRPVYSPSGHLVFQPSRDTHELWAMPLSLTTLETSGERFPIAQNARLHSVAADGTLVYLDGAHPGSGEQLVWLDRTGATIGRIGQTQDDIREPVLSRDGSYVAAASIEASNEDIWIWSIDRGVKTRLTVAPDRDYRVAWSPTGSEIAFSSARSGNLDIFLSRSDGGTETTSLVAEPLNERVCDWSDDGKYILYDRIAPETGHDLWFLERSEGKIWQAHSLLQTPFVERAVKLSPDGRYIAYVSDESGRGEIYVRTFPKADKKWPISDDGGRQPRWGRDGKELFYVEGSRLVRIPVTLGSSFSAGRKTYLFDHLSLQTGNPYPEYDVSLDGQRFLFAEPVGDVRDSSIRVTQNWYEEFRDREQD